MYNLRYIDADALVGIIADRPYCGHRDESFALGDRESIITQMLSSVNISRRLRA